MLEIGWLPMELMSLNNEHVKNPRQIFLDAHDQGKQYIAHVIKTTDNNKVSVCGKATFICGIFRDNGQTIMVADINSEYEVTNNWIKRAYPCPECNEFFNKNKSLFMENDANELV